MAPPDDERRAARLATASALIVVASFVASKAARDAILLAHFPIRALPIFIAVAAAVALPVILLAGRLMTRHGPARLMPVLNTASALLAVVEWSLLRRYPGPVSVAVYLHLSTAGAVLVSGFWSIVNERFDVQSAKRHIGRIGMGATLGGIFGGVIAERTAVYLAPDKILLVLAGLQLGCAATLWLASRGGARAPVVTEPQRLGAALRVVARSPLLRHLGAIVVLGAIAAGILDYVFKADLVHGGKHDLLRSLAMFYTVTSVVTAILQITVCGPLIARLGVPRSVATLPIAVTAFAALAVAVPTALAAAIARGAESVTRNSIYRSGYELLYAPLSEAHKRPNKLVLDVGADRIGDLLGAQLVGVIVYAMAAPRAGLLIATVGVGALAVAVALRLPRSYTRALEDSLMSRAPEPPAAADPEAPPAPWLTLTGLPSLGLPGDFVPLSRRPRPRRAPPTPARPGPVAASAPPGDPVVDAVIELRSGDPARIRRALAALPPELAVHAIDLVARDDVSRDALAALSAVAARCTGLLVDAVLDPARDLSVRRRLPAVLFTGEPALAAWGLWRALADPSFDVRYRSGAVLARLAAAGHLGPLAAEDVFDAVRRELATGHGTRAGQLTADLVAAGDLGAGEALLRPAAVGLEHIFTMLGLTLPAEPLRIALHAVQTDDPELRGTALEYLESILPPDVRAQLWPLLEGDGEGAAAPAPEPAAAAVPHDRRSHDQLLAALHLSYPAVVEQLRRRTSA